MWRNSNVNFGPSMAPSAVGGCLDCHKEEGKMKKLASAFYNVLASLRALFCILMGKPLMYKVKWIGRGQCRAPLDVISCTFEKIEEGRRIIDEYILSVESGRVVKRKMPRLP